MEPVSQIQLIWLQILDFFSPVKTSVWPTYMGPVTPIAEGRLEIAATLEPKVGSM